MKVWGLHNFFLLYFSYDLFALNYPLTHIIAESHKNKKFDLKPFPNVTKFSDASKEQRTRWEQVGHTLIADNKVAILLLAGGQASRLGCTVPKGMFGIFLMI